MPESPEERPLPWRYVDPWGLAFGVLFLAAMAVDRWLI